MQPIHKCQFCDFCTLENRLLEAHVHEKHEKESVDISKYVKPIFKCPVCDFSDLEKESLDSHMEENNHFDIEEIPTKNERRDINSNITICNNVKDDGLNSTCQEQKLLKPLKKVEDSDDEFHGFYRFDCPHCDFIGFDQIEIGQHVIAKHAELQVERNAKTRKKLRSN